MTPEERAEVEENNLWLAHRMEDAEARLQEDDDVQEARFRKFMEDAGAEA